jgi:hypothetical protein
MIMSTPCYSGVYYWLVPPGIQFKVRRMSNLFALACKSALQSCLRIHLDCLTAVKSNLFGPQDCLERCRGGHQGELIPFFGIPLAPTNVIVCRT